MKKNLKFLGMVAVGIIMSGCSQQQAASTAGLSPEGGYGTPGSYDASGAEVVAGETVTLDGQGVSSNGVGTSGVGSSAVSSSGSSRAGSGSGSGSGSGYNGGGYGGSSSAGAGSSADGNGRNSVYFGYDSNRLQSTERSKISSDAGTLKSRSNVKVEGNSDEFGTDEYNYALGLKRAKAVKDEMVARGVDASKVSVVSYGESNPVCADGTKECYQKNRRADYN